MCSHSDDLSTLRPHLPILHYPLPESTRAVVVYVVSPPSSRASSRYFLFIGFSCGDTQCPSDISHPVDLPCPGPRPSSHLFNHVCDLCLFSYSCVFLSRYVIFNILLSIFVCAAASLFFAWVVNAHVSRRMSLLEVRMSCRFVSSSMSQCYP